MRKRKRASTSTEVVEDLNESDQSIEVVETQTAQISDIGTDVGDTDDESMDISVVVSCSNENKLVPSPKGKTISPSKRLRLSELDAETTERLRLVDEQIQTINKHISGLEDQIDGLLSQRKELLSQKFEITRDTSILNVIKNDHSGVRRKYGCMSNTQLANLSADTLYTCFSFLPLYPDVMNIAMVCSQWKKVVTSERNMSWRVLRPHNTIKDEHLIQISQMFPHIDNCLLGGCKSLTDSAIRLSLSSFKSMRVLDLTETCTYAVTVKQIIKKHQELTKLSLESTTDLTLDFIASNCPNITELYVKDASKITDEAGKFLGSICKLRALVLEEVYKLTDDGISFLCTSKKNKEKSIQKLTLRCIPKVTSLGLNCISQNFHELTSLTLMKCHGVLFDSYDKTKTFENLTALDIGYCENLTEQGLDRILEACPQLKTLCLQKVRIVDIRPAHATLETISVRNCFSVTGLNITQLVSLRSLTVDKCNSLAFATISNAPTMKDIRISNCRKLSRFEIGQLCGEIQSLEILYCPHITSMKLSEDSIQSIVEIALDGCKNLDPKSLEAILDSAEVIQLVSVVLCDRFTSKWFAIAAKEYPQIAFKHSCRV